MESSMGRSERGKGMKKRAVGLLLALSMVLGMSMNAAAAETKIEKVKIEFSWGDVPKAGDRPGSISASAGGDEYSVGDVYYTNDVDDYWTLGTTPEVVAMIHAKNGYKFSSTSKTYFSITGDNAKYKRARLSDGNTTLELTVTFPQLTGRLPQVENNYWEDTVAVWDELDGARSYEIRLYRNEKLLTTVKSTEANYDFASSFTREGDYSFKVRGIAKYNNNPGEWCEQSDYQIITASQAATSGTGRWVQDARGWWYSYSTGGYPASVWKQVDGVWYYFDKDGYMMTGWVNIGGTWYYLASNGGMTTGWQAINGRWYYMDGSGAMTTGWQTVNGRKYFMDSSGGMLTGWQYIDNNWYYFDTASGALYTSTITPDGYHVDSWGIWHR